MEAASIDAFTPEVKREIFHQLELVESHWNDLGGFESFVFANHPMKKILRVTHTSHRTLADIESELEFLTFLDQSGDRVGRVSVPIRLQDSLQADFAVQIGEFVCCKFEMAPGRLIEEADWGVELFQSWGASIGKFHRLASEYTPTKPARFDWQLDANLNFRSRIPAEEEKILQLSDGYLAQLSGLAQSKGDYGLIHSDAHSSNFFIHHESSNQGVLTFFDFDDCCYQWYAFDIATIVFSSILQPWMSEAQAFREAEAQRFVTEFLKGYRTQFEVSGFTREHFNLFLKLRELSLFAVIHSHLDVNNLTEAYPIRFMKGRKERLEADLPYLELVI